MTDTTWAAKVLEGVPRHNAQDAKSMTGYAAAVWLHEDAVVDAIAKLGAGDDMVERLQKLADDMGKHATEEWDESELVNAAIAHIAALTAQNRELALDVLASSGQAQEAYAAQIAAEAERDALRAKVARLEGVLTDMPKAVLCTTVCQGPVWPDDRPGVWLAALEACAKSVQAAVDAAFTDGGSAKPTVEQIIHLYGVDALCKALVPVILQEAADDARADARAEALKEAAAVAAKFDSDGMYGAAAIHDAILALAPTTTTR